MRHISSIIDTQTKHEICPVHGDYVSTNSLRIAWSPCQKCAEVRRKASIEAAIESFNKNQAKVAGSKKKRATGFLGGSNGR